MKIERTQTIGSLPLVVGVKAAAIAGAVAVAGPMLAIAAEPDPVLARVNGYEIRHSEVMRVLEALPLADQIEPRANFRPFVEAVVQEEVVLQWVMGQAVPAAPALRDRIRDEVFAAAVRTHVKRRVQVTEKQVRAYYHANPHLVRGEHVRVRAIVRPARAECDALRRRLRTEEAFAEQAKRLSLDKASAANGGDLGYLMRVKGELGFEPELFRLNVGESAVFESAQGCHLVLVTERIDPPLLPFGLMRDNIRAFLEAREEQRLLAQMIEQASRATRIEWLAQPAP